MSLINQMLRDLDRQQRPQATAGSSATDAVEPRPSRRLPLPLLVTVSLAVALLLTWWFAGLLVVWLFPSDTPVAPTVAPPVAVQPVDQPQLPPPVSTATSDQDAPTSVVRSEGPDTGRQVENDRPPANGAAAVSRQIRVASAPAKPAPRPDLEGGEIKPMTAAGRVERPRLRPETLPEAVVPAPAPAPAETRAKPSTPFGTAEAAYRQAVQAYQANRSGEAVRLLGQVLNVYPGHLSARELLADIQEMEGRVDKAIALLTEGLEIAPEQTPLKKRLARLLVDQGRDEAAIAVLLKSGMPAIGEEPAAHALLASLYQRLGEGFLAAQTYRNLLALWPRTGTFWVGLGQALETDGQTAEAAQAYRQALATESLPGDLRRQVEKRLNSWAE